MFSPPFVMSANRTLLILQEIHLGLILFFLFCFLMFFVQFDLAISKLCLKNHLQWIIYLNIKSFIYFCALRPALFWSLSC